MESTIIYVLFVIAIFIIVFLVIREFWTWYWKINDILELLLIQNKLLRKIADNFEDDEIEEIEHKEYKYTKEDYKVINERQPKEKKTRKTLKEMIEDEKRKLISK